MTAGATQQADARRLLLAGLVDYAGLFPPAGLPMADAVARYDEYRKGEHAWALGKFVVPVARLTEFADAARPLFGGGGAWRLAVVAGADFRADVRAIAGFARRAAPGAGIGAIEVKASTAEQVGDIADAVVSLRTQVSDAFDTYVEVPIADDPSPLIRSIASHGLRAKVRTGGVEAGAFPTAAQLARFLGACTALGVPFKATAGLHHALRGAYPLTYDRESERGMMFGFLNVFLAAMFTGDGLDAADARELLEERDPGSFAFSASGVAWRGRAVTAAAIRGARDRAAVSFGSCSFAEPVADLSSLGLL
ncbi:MAG: hypothetical protein ACHQQR_00970 [Gemmatimonadales bacterium]